MTGLRTRLAPALALAAALFAAPAGAIVHPGNVAPEFTKNLLGGGAASLSGWSGKVVVLFLLGYD